MEEAKILMILNIAKTLQDKERRRRFKMYRLAFINVLNRMNGDRTRAYALWRHFNDIYSAEPRVWQLPRPPNGFDDYYNSDNPDLGYWKENFRMSRNTFHYICDLCAPFLQTQDTTFRKALPLPKRVAVALGWLANGGSQRDAGVPYGISRSASQEIIADFLDGIYERRHDFIIFPQTGNQCRDAIASYTGKALLPNLLGCIDKIVVEIRKPYNNSLEYYTSKQKHMLSSQVVCDGDLRFLVVDSGHPGILSSNKLFRKSWLAEALENSTVLQKPIVTLNDGCSKLTPYLVGDQTYPTFPGIITPYPAGNTNFKGEKDLNKQIAQARKTIDQCINLLKLRWKILLKCLDVSPERASKIVTVCCILHNILQNRREDFDEDEIVVDSHTQFENIDEDSMKFYSNSFPENLRSILTKHIQSELLKEN